MLGDMTVYFIINFIVFYFQLEWNFGNSFVLSMELVQVQYVKDKEPLCSVAYLKQTT